MQLIFKDNKYVALCKRGEGILAQRAGFSRTSKNRRYWYTRDPFVASRLVKYADMLTRQKIEIECNKRNKSYDMSFASKPSSNIVIPCPEGLEYLPYQIAGIEFALRRNNTLIADCMGLGKTIQALGYINIRRDMLDKILIICPASLKINWIRECEKWLTTNHTIGIVDRQNHLDTNICIINYAMLYNYNLIDINWDLVIIDESHALKNEDSKRTKYIMCLNSKYKILLTGTPMPNRPIELWTVLHYLDPENWPSRLAYSKYYCEGHKGYWEWEEKGAANMDELNRLIRETIMIRRSKEDVLPQLPAKRRQIIEIPVNKTIDILEKELNMFKDYQLALEKLEVMKKQFDITFNEENYRKQIQKMEANVDAIMYQLSEIRHETAFAKIPFILDHITNTLHNIDKLVVFGYHRDVLETYYETFKDISVLMYGGMNINKKQDAIDKFQSDPKCKIFFCSIEVAVGFNLTAASNVIFAEWDWVPANMNQAEDRCHRIGQTKSVLVQYTVLENSIDVIMAKQLIRKQKVIENILDIK